jgi:polysaccharide pyruvyl transferase WcaK-like protein
VRIHLGHHFYGAGNLGDDFMVAGFLRALESLRVPITLTGCVPFDLAPLARRFPQIAWQAYTSDARTRCIAECDAWLGLGGSPFQSAQSRWFIDHLAGEAERCATAGKPMFYLGVGVQTAEEVRVPEVRTLCAQARGIWTRDAASAERLQSLGLTTPIAAGADLAHILFSHQPPPSARTGALALVANFDYGAWPGRDACLQAIQAIAPTERIWLAQESRELPGAERALFAGLPKEERARWQLAVPDEAGAPLAEVVTRWPSGEWLITSRFHAAIAGAWAGSKVVVIGTNEKLRSIAQDLGTPLIEPEADPATVLHALKTARPSPPPLALASQAEAACAAFIRSAVAPHR